MKSVEDENILKDIVSIPSQKVNCACLSTIINLEECLLLSYSYLFFLCFQCESNGINYNALHRNSGIDSNIQTLEMFFSGLPRLINLQPFPNLSKLVIVNQNIEHIEGLDTCVNLRELWITECKLTVRTYLSFGLTKCSQAD